jgi:acetyltransferase-like isoleucine patch superfamily enzyme
VSNRVGTPHIVDSAQIFEPVVMTRADSIFIDAHARIDSFVKLEGGKRLHIGKHVHIASMAHLGIGGGETILEDYSAVASGGKIISGSNSPEGQSMSAAAPPEMQVVKTSKTVIGKYAIVFTNATVMPGVTLGEGAVLAAGAVATKDIPAWEIWAGVPARKIGTRQVKK